MNGLGPEPHTITASSGDIGLEPRPAWWKALVAPWLAMIRPGVGLRIMGLASMRAVAVCIALQAALWAGIIAASALWGDAIRVDSSRAEGLKPIAYRTLLEVRAEWNAGAWFGATELMFLSLWGTAIGFAFAGAWLCLVDSHADEGFGRAFRRSLRAVVTSSAVVLVLTTIVAVHAAYMTRQMEIWRAGQSGGRVFLGPPYVELTFTLGGSVLWLSLARCAAARLRPATALSSLTPRCESCGYDLTHVPEDRRCPECSRDADESLTAGRTRRPSRWETRRDVPSLVATSWRALVRPGEFYRSLTVLDEPLRMTRFAAAHLFAITVGAFLWIFTCMVMIGELRSSPYDELAVICILTLAVLAAAYLTYLAAAAIVVTVWSWTRPLPAFRAARKIVAVEAAYLWVFCLYDGLLATSVFFTNWPRAALVRQFFGNLGGAPPEPVLVLFGNGALIAWWFWRYRRITDAVRYANF
ncbi:MAG: hypothetical protein L6Q92_14820 [Phycisphaerae bacterium]|nr:hypothetical protein [Phycisphaerae bacterium]